MAQYVSRWAYHNMSIVVTGICYQGWYGGFLLQVDLPSRLQLDQSGSNLEARNPSFLIALQNRSTGCFGRLRGGCDSTTIFLILESSFWLDIVASCLETLFLRWATGEEYEGSFHRDVTDETLLLKLRPLSQNKGSVVWYHHWLVCLGGSILIGHRCLACLAGVCLSSLEAYSRQRGEHSFIWRISYFCERTFWSFFQGLLGSGVSNKTLPSDGCSPEDVFSKFGGEDSHSGKMEGWIGITCISFQKEANTEL